MSDDEFESGKEPICTKESPIMFISENYRKKLDISCINCTKNIDCNLPNRLLTYFYFAMRACHGHMQLYSFLMFVLAFLGFGSVLYFIMSKVTSHIISSLGFMVILVSLFTNFDTIKYKQAIILFMVGISMIILGALIEISYIKCL